MWQARPDGGACVDSVTHGRLAWDRQSTTKATYLLDHEGGLDLYFADGRNKGDAAVPGALLHNAGEAGFMDRSSISTATGTRDIVTASRRSTTACA